jgi:RNA polymerase sigma factor (sigma-70 family)
MTVVGNKPPPATPPEDPVRTALEDPVVRNRLGQQAHAILHKRTNVRGIEIDDVVQKTILRAIECRASFDGRPVGAWLHGVLVNIVREEIRFANHQPVQQPADTSLWAGSVVATAPQDADLAAIRTFVEQHLIRLSPDDRTVVRMRFFDGLSLQDIAVKLNIGYVAARMRFSRALRRLQELARTSPEERP